jgi:hypothetical protein
MICSVAQSLSYNKLRHYMNLFPKYPLCDELVEGSDGSTTDAAVDVEGETAPEYFVGEYTADDTANYLGQVKELPERFRSLESRFTGALDPIQQRMAEMQANYGSQPVFNPKMERTLKALGEYDPKLAELLKDALTEDLKSSMAINPLDRGALEPHISPMLNELRQQLSIEAANTVIEALPFDANVIVNRENPESPVTDLQKAFKDFWDRADHQMRGALATPGLGYARALQQFSKWYAEKTKGQGAAAGASSARLNAGRQVGNGARAKPAGPKDESQAFEAGFNEVLAQMKRN